MVDSSRRQITFEQTFRGDVDGLRQPDADRENTVMGHGGDDGRPRLATPQVRVHEAEEERAVESDVSSKPTHGSITLSFAIGLFIVYHISYNHPAEIRVRRSGGV